MSKKLTSKQLSLMSACFSSREEVERLGYYFNFTVPEIACLFYDNEKYGLKNIAFELLYKWSNKNYLLQDKLSALETAANECDLKYLLEEVQKQKQINETVFVDLASERCK